MISVFKVVFHSFFLFCQNYNGDKDNLGKCEQVMTKYLPTVFYGHYVGKELKVFPWILGHSMCPELCMTLQQLDMNT